MIHYVKGDATAPIGEGMMFIAHICNNIGGWGAGFVLAVSRRWSAPEKEYRRLAAARLLTLGRIDIIDVHPNIAVVNMVAQDGVGPDAQGRPPIRYDALELCLHRLSGSVDIYRTAKTPFSVHMPRIGCGLAGGKWEEIEPILQRKLANTCEVYVYSL